MIGFKSTLLPLIFTLCLGQYSLAQCPSLKNSLVYAGNDKFVSYQDLASHAAPMLWFSPDEAQLYNEEGKIQLPQKFPFESASTPIVYYKVLSLYSRVKKSLVLPNNNQGNKALELIDLSKVNAIDLDFYYYFEEETGLGGHGHDIEYVSLQLKVNWVLNCPDYKYTVEVIRVLARSHGLHWFDNIFDVDEYTTFPLSILIEEGKHGSCTDKNADGIYTPGYDVTRRINDAWGVRDIISTGKLFSGGYQGWMSKNRTEETIIFPPLPKSSPHYEEFIEKYQEKSASAVYQLRPYPKYPRNDIDKLLNTKMKEKKNHDWPRIEKSNGDGSIKRWSKEEKIHKQWSTAYRWSDTQSLSFSVPLFIFKSAEAPMTGGWLVNKLYFGSSTPVGNESYQYTTILGHQIVHMPSASRWLDSYVGMGYELHDLNPDPSGVERTTKFVSEIGLKIRVNITKTPLKFFSWIGPDYWGVRMGWKNIGFGSFKNGAFVLEIGAGAF